MKKIAILILCLTIVVSSCVGGILLYRVNKRNNTKVEVTPVVNISTQDWGSQMNMYGIATNQMMQEIYLNSDQRVLEVLVSQGDEVEIGTPLLKLDTTLAEIELEEKKIAVQKLEIEINNTKKEIEKWKATKPYEQPSIAPPVIEVPDVEKPIVETVEELFELSQAYKGDGTPQDPYMFRCSPTCIVKASFFNEMSNKNVYVKLEIKPEDEYTPFYIWEMNGAEISKIEQEIEETESSDTSESTSGMDEKDPTLPVEDNSFTDWVIGTIEKENDTVVLALNLQQPIKNANLKLVLQTESREDDSQSPDIGDTQLPIEEPGYTLDELTKLIAEAEQKLKDYDLQKRQMQLACTLAEKKLEDTTIKSSVKGKVQFVRDIKQANEAEMPFMSVNGGDGFYITGTISELMLDKIKVGTAIQATSWGEGGQQFYEAEITEIASYPTSDSIVFGGENPNTSYYPFTAYIADAQGLVNGMGMDMNVNVDGNIEAIFIDKAYIREENGKYYVYAVNEQQRLEKRYVKTGKVLHDAFLEIKEGVSMEDYLAFPYGKNVKSGVKVKLPEDNMIVLPNIQIGW